VVGRAALGAYGPEAITPQPASEPRTVRGAGFVGRRCPDTFPDRL